MDGWCSSPTARHVRAARTGFGSAASTPPPRPPEINQLDRPGAVAEYLHRERFTVPMLREIARALGPTVPTTGRSKDEVIRDIVEGTAGFRIRSAAMSGGAWG